jgi:CheY-like chemotaxis protein
MKQRFRFMMKKILVFDDDEGILDIVDAILSLHSYEVKTISHGKKAVDLVKYLRPDLVLINVFISGTDGRDICRQIKTDPEINTIPVVLFSAHAKAQELFNDCDANDFIAKPFDLEKLVEVVEKHI